MIRAKETKVDYPDNEASKMKLEKLRDRDKAMREKDQMTQKMD